MRTIITKAHNRSFEIWPIIKAGDSVRFDRMDTGSPGWFFGADAAGVEGYFPAAWFAIDELAGTALALRDYNAEELTVAVGVEVEVAERYGGWALVRCGDAQGWVPESCCYAKCENS